MQLFFSIFGRGLNWSQLKKATRAASVALEVVMCHVLFLDIDGVLHPAVPSGEVFLKDRSGWSHFPGIW